MMARRAIHPLQIVAAVGAAFVLWGLLLAYAASPAWAAEITVNSLADDADRLDGECTLREAINSANTDPTSEPAAGECANGSGDDVIKFALPGKAPWTVNLTEELPELSTNIELVGPGANRFTVRRDTGGKYRIFTVSSGSVVSITRLTISNGLADHGGGISNSGRLVLTRSTVTGNAANGQYAGGIYNDSELILKGSTVSHNVAPEFAGGINNFFGGETTLIRSTVSNNTVDSPKTNVFRAGGGINTGIDSTVRVVNSTISGNTIMGNGRGGGISNFSGQVRLKNDTLTGNQGTSGANLGSNGITRVKNTVVANPRGGDNCAEVAGIITSNGYNLDSGTSCGFTAIGDIQNQNPLLGPLRNNGGPTKTHALLEGSPAIDQGNSFGTNRDQRGKSRPHDFATIDNAPGGDGSDIGAFEVQP